MSEEVDFWTPTITAFAPLGLPSPELTPKLLKKPPFRFIHDLVRAINGRFDAYTHIIPPPLDSMNTIETKEQKVQYLQLLISYIEGLLKVAIDVNPKKIISGSEPEKTNIFLQYIAMAVGNAQQDKQLREAQGQFGVASPCVAPPPPPPPSGGPNGIDRASLPKAKKKKEKEKSNVNNIMAKVQEFQRKITNYSIDVSGPINVEEDGKRIVEMWKSLDAPKPPVTEAGMPLEALEIALSRQIEALHQIEKMHEENDEIIQRLEEILL